MFNPEDFAGLANRILLGPGGAAEARTAVGRAYYFAFLTAKRLLDPHFRFAKHAEVHKQLYMLFVNCSGADAREIGRNLDDLRDVRNDADYRLEDLNIDDLRVATRYVGLSIRAVAKMRNLLDSPSASQLVAEMKNWARISGKVTVR